MSVTVCRTPAALFHKENAAIDICSEPTKVPNRNRDEKRPDQSFISTMIQSQKSPTHKVAEPYVHPLVRRLSSFLSKSSLEMCTESLGSENGSGEFSDDDQNLLNSTSNKDVQVSIKHKKLLRDRVVSGEDDGNQLISVSHLISDSRRSPVHRSFPPPLSSRHDGTCIQLRTCRHDGRLIVRAVPIASQNYLHARRQEGRLLLSFIDPTATSQPTVEKTTEVPVINNKEQMVEQVPPPSKQVNQTKEVAEYEDEDEEEVEVLDRGTIVEVKVSSQLQHPGGGKKVHRSSLVINKFVGVTPLTNQNRWAEPIEENHRRDLAVSEPPPFPQRRLTATTSTTTAATAAVAASSVSASSEVVGQQKPDNKLLFTSKRRNRKKMLQHMRRCSELRRPLFFWEAGCIATST